MRDIKKIGTIVQIVGEITEYLQLNHQEWITVKLPDNQYVTLNIKHCKFIPNANTEST